MVSELNNLMRGLMATGVLRKEVYAVFCEDVAKACTMPVDYLVTILVDDHFITEYLEYDGDHDRFAWNNDWYEGQKFVRFVGCVPVRDLRVEGSGESVTVEVWNNAV